jgi:hypothetical protein
MHHRLALRAISGSLGLLLLAATGVAGATAANADAPSPSPFVLSQADTERLATFLTDNGVPADTQVALLDKLEAGGTWDSMAGKAPVSITTSSDGSEKRTISTYADGSIVVDTMQLPTPAATPTPGTITPMDVKNCRSTAGGSGYVNFYDCQASSSTGLMVMGFNISYSIVNGGYDKITNVNSPYREASPGTATAPVLGIKKATENASGSAWASIVSTYTGPTGSPSGTYEMRALVGNNTAWTRWEQNGPE